MPSTSFWSLIVKNQETVVYHYSMRKQHARWLSPASCLISCLRCSCPPRSFIPALCKIFLDEEAPDNVLEVTARALTYYLDVSVECSRRITTVDGALKAIIARMYAADMETRMSKDLVEQSVKVRQRSSYVLAHVCRALGRICN